MKYSVTINGKKYELPARTIDVDDKIDAVGALDEQYKGGDITRRECIEKMHEFVEGLAPGALPSAETVDTNDLLRAAFDIVKAYTDPERQMRAESELSGVLEIINRPEVKKLLEAAKLLDK